MLRSSPRSLFTLPALAAAAVAVVLALGFPATGRAALPVHDVTLAARGTSTWKFVGDIAVRMFLADSKTGRCVFEGYSFPGGDRLWTVDARLGADDVNFSSLFVSYPGDGLMLVGLGPVSLIDTRKGVVRWTIPCAVSGLADEASAKLVGDGKLMFIGSRKCDQSLEDAWGDAAVLLVDVQTGALLWKHPVKSYVYDIKLGSFWKRLDAIENGRSTVKEKREQLVLFPVAPGEDGHVISNSGSNADQVLVVGEGLEGIRLSDGQTLWKSKGKAGLLRGAYGRTAFLRDGDDLTAYDVGSGQVAWQMDLAGHGAHIYTSEELQGQGDHPPADMDYLLVSEAKRVSRVDPATGKSLWDVERDDASWQPTSSALLVEGKDRLTGYDYANGKPLWQMKSGRLLHAYGEGDTVLMVERGKLENGTHLGPFAFWAITAHDGHVLWSRSDIEGKKITRWQLLDDGQVLLVSEKGERLLVGTDDGQPTPPTTGARAYRYVQYFPKDKALQCTDVTGKLVWERRGEKSANFRFQLRHDRVLWAAHDGLVEVIDVQDGSSLWNGHAGPDPQPWLDQPGTHLVVEQEGQATFLTLGD